MIRLDHFRGFAAAWHVPAGAPTAQSGEWVPGPGAEYFAVMKREFGSLPFIAEDLGVITPDVTALRDQFHVPGTRVLQFAFDGGPDNPHLPANFVSNTVVHTGTHDNNTTRGWYEGLPDDRRQKLRRYMEIADVESTAVTEALLKMAWSSAGALALAPLQDLLNLGGGPHERAGKRQRELVLGSTKQMLSTTAFDRLRDLTRSTKRSPTNQ